VRRLPLVVLAIALVWVGLAPPAAAHGEGSTEAPASNYRSRITSVEPEIPGVGWRMIDAGTRIEVTNTTSTPLVVIGDSGEPFLRVGPDGVHENTRSITAFRLANPGPGIPVPQDLLQGGEPEWREVASGRSYAWHDDRAHWTDADPASVREDPSATTVVVPEWRVEALWGDAPVAVVGDITWIPGPPLWPSVVAVLCLAAVLAALAWGGRFASTLAVAGGLSIAASALVEVGVWWASADSGLAKFERFVLPAVAWLLLAAALVRFRAAPQESVLLAAGASVGIGVLLGVTGWRWLVRSQLPTALPSWLGRASVVAALGAGVGMLVAAAIVWFREGYRSTSATVSPGRPVP